MMKTHLLFCFWSTGGGSDLSGSGCLGSSLHGGVGCSDEVCSQSMVSGSVPQPMQCFCLQSPKITNI